MENTMETIARYIQDNYTSFGLSSPTDLKLLDNPAQSLPDGARWLILLEESTVPDMSITVPFANSAAPQSAKRLKSKVRIECRTRNPDPVSYPDFFWDTAQQMRDKVFASLSGTQGDGLILSRYDWTDPQNPVQAGEIWFEVSPSLSPLEESREGDTVHNKSITLTYQVHWWNTAFSGDAEPCDPWLEILAVWTELKLGAEWTVLRNNYQQVVQRPSVSWSLSGSETKPANTTLFEVSKKFTANITGLLPNQHSSASLTLVQELAKQVKILFDLPSHQYLTVINPQVTAADDSSLTVKVNVTLTRKIRKPLEEAPLITAINKVGIFQ